MSPHRTQRAIPLFDLQVTPQARKKVADVLACGWLSSGPVATELETSLAAVLKVPHVAAVSSATAGLIAALKAAGIGPGDEVIVPSFTFVATAEAVLTVGADVRFADIDPHRWTLDPASVTKKITRRTRGIIPVDFAGVPADYPALKKIARAHRLVIISDSSHALGTTLHGRAIPQHTDFSVFSLHVTKNLTSAEGGIVCARTRSDDAQVRLLSRHGVTRNAWQRRSKGSAAYDVLAHGLKGNLPDLLAALAVGELVSFRRHQAIRERLSHRYLSNFRDFSACIQPITVPSGAQSGWHLFPVRLAGVRTESQRNQVVRKMKELGIECGIHYRPLHRMTLFRVHRDAYSLPNTDRLGRSVLVLPLYPVLTPSDIDLISTALVSVLSALKLR